LLLQFFQPLNTFLVNCYVQLKIAQRLDRCGSMVASALQMDSGVGLPGTTDFQLDILEVQEQPEWIIVPVFGAIGMNKAGWQNRKVKPVASHFLKQL
jgi:hypothetical protein